MTDGRAATHGYTRDGLVLPAQSLDRSLVEKKQSLVSPHSSNAFENTRSLPLFLSLSLPLSLSLSSFLPLSLAEGHMVS